MKIVTVPSEILAKKTSPVVNIDKRILKIIEDMKKTLLAQKDPQGVGLAAPQVGYQLQLFIISPDLKSKPEVFINPTILKTEGETEKALEMPKKNKKARKLEGCLSIPQIWGLVKRAAKVNLEYQDLTGQKIKKWFSGFPAIIIQHEMDHLTGILFTQRVLEQGNKLYKEEKGKLKEYEI